MKTLALLLFFSIIYFTVDAQSFAVVKDKDGYVNVYKTESVTSTVIGKVDNNRIIRYNDDDKSAWVKVPNGDFDGINNFSEFGYIQKFRILPLSELKTIKMIKRFKDSCAAFNDSLTIKIKSQHFNPKQHKLLYAKSASGQNILTQLNKIDGEYISGTDGNVPVKSISAVKIIKKGMAFNLPKNVINDLYEPQFDNLKVYIGDDNFIYIQMDNGDGGGSYTVIWIIKDGKYYRRYLDYSRA